MIQDEVQKTIKGNVDPHADLRIRQWLKDNDVNHNIIVFYQSEGDSSTISGQRDLIEAFSKYLTSIGYREV